MTEHTCDDALHELYRFLDGELDDERRDRIKAHLDDCSPCLEAFDFEVELRRVVSSRCREQVPDELRGRILDVIRSTSLEPGEVGQIGDVPQPPLD